MAKKTTTTTTSNYPVVKLTAFWGIIISGVASLVALTFQLLCRFNWDWLSKAAAPLGTIAGIMQIIASIALFISAFLAGWSHSRGKSKVWKILFWIFSILALLGILGVNILVMPF